MLLGAVSACGTDEGDTSGSSDYDCQGSGVAHIGTCARPTYFDELVVSGMCRAPESADSGQLDLSLQMLGYTVNGTLSLSPSDTLNQADGPQQVSDLVQPSAFKFAMSTACDASIDAAVFHACVEASDPPDAQRGASLLAQDIRYETPGGPTRTADDRLVVLLLDNSGSLKGQPDPLSPVDKATASDARDERITFLKNLVRLPYLEQDTYFSLVWFDQHQPHITPEFATPTRNRDVLVCPAGADGTKCQADAAMDGLTKLASGETGATPLADALDQTYKVVINGDTTQDLSPVVVLFTDGVESGDASASGKTVAEVAQSYANHTHGGERTPVPVIVLHLQPTLASGLPRGRDPALYALACATGGEYIFLERADELTTSETLEPLVANRLTGAWKLRVSSTDTIGLEAGSYLLSSELSVTLGEKIVTTRLEPNRDAADDDTRLWFVK
jgi:hypothetical protein